MTLALALKLGGFLIALILGLDVYLAADGVVGNTWSEIGKWIGNRVNMVVPWCVAGLVGHIWHPFYYSDPIIKSPGNIVMLVWTTVLVSMISFAATRAGHPIPAWTVLLPAYFTWWALWPV